MRRKLQQDILDMLARGSTIEEAGNAICRHAEQLADGVLCSIVTIDQAGLIHPLAGESISKAYSQALDGIEIGPGVGSCGTAAFLRRPVAVEDIFGDPRWAPYQSLADILLQEHGVKACWSSPIMRSDGRVLGAFGFYYRENRGPTAKEQTIVADCVDLCSIVLEREEVKAENVRLAYFDTLTGLGNRANFIETLEATAKATTEPLAVLLFDIDHLGRVNDAFGHAIGDSLIVEVGRTITQRTAEKTVFRVDADEFAVLIANKSAAEINVLATQIIQAVESRTLRQVTHAFPLSVSCGATISDPSRPPDVATFLQQANLALHHAKNTARGSFALYTDDLADAIAQRFRTLQAVLSALSENRIETHYQPIVRLDTQQTVGLEALCRLRTTEGQIISAGQFADALQDLSMGHLLTDRMLQLVANDLRLWLDQAVDLQYVSINVSMADFAQGNLRERILKSFKAKDIPLNRVVIEVTESVYMDAGDRRVAQTIEDMRSDGLQVALDDFGTGYASLTHLLDLPVDIVKIDKTFVDRMPDGVGEVIVKALLDMAAGLGVRIVAEGVETADQSQRLQRLGCPFVQGYRFGRPIGREETTKALELAKG